MISFECFSVKGLKDLLLGSSLSRHSINSFAPTRANGRGYSFYDLQVYMVLLWTVVLWCTVYDVWPGCV